MPQTMRVTLRRLAACAVAPLLAAGCGGPAVPLFPLESGREWQYRVTTTYEDASVAPARERLVLRTGGASEVGGATAWRRTSASGMNYWLRADETGVFRVASQGPLDAAPRVDAPVRYVLKQPFATGTEWEADTTPYVLARRNEFPRELRHLPRYRTLAMKYRIEATRQAVTTPAGGFDDCVRVKGVAVIRLHVDELFEFRDVPITTTEWYCPGVGLVKQERVEHSPTKFILGGTTTLELAAFK